MYGTSEHLWQNYICSIGLCQVLKLGTGFMFRVLIVFTRSDRYFIFIIIRCAILIRLFEHNIKIQIQSQPNMAYIEIVSVLCHDQVLHSRLHLRSGGECNLDCFKAMKNCLFFLRQR